MTASYDPAARYSRVAMTLHWAIALAIVVQIGMGWYMGTLGRAPLHRTLEGVHISLGLTVLILTVVRLAWGLTHTHPRLPADMPAIERRLAGAIHVLFYVLLFALPLSGWVMESFGSRPIPFWGLAWPHFPMMAQITAGADPRALKETIEEIHGSPMVWTMIALIALHVAGAIKHQFDGRPILWRMAGWMKRPLA
jgi:cytochrome b561